MDRADVAGLVVANWTDFIPEFLEYLPANFHVFEAFEAEALKIVARGFSHYSGNTIIEVLRHHSALAQVGDTYKLNDKYTPYLARLFALVHPTHAELFEYRISKADRLHLLRIAP
jgi:hypothetical protein